MLAAFSLISLSAGESCAANTVTGASLEAEHTRELNLASSGITGAGREAPLEDEVGLERELRSLAEGRGEVKLRVVWVSVTEVTDLIAVSVALHWVWIERAEINLIGDAIPVLIHGEAELGHEGDVDACRAVDHWLEVSPLIEGALIL